MPVLEEEIPINLHNDITRSRPREKTNEKNQRVKEMKFIISTSL